MFLINFFIIFIGWIWLCINKSLYFYLQSYNYETALVPIYSCINAKFHLRSQRRNRFFILSFYSHKAEIIINITLIINRYQVFFIKPSFGCLSQTICIDYINKPVLFIKGFNNSIIPMIDESPSTGAFIWLVMEISLF